MGLELFNKHSRPQLFRQLSNENFDLLIIGGGITGASIFRDACLRGMRVALIESHDFAAGTSGRSSKLIHGGLRYLLNLDFRLVWEACHERDLHVRLNKRLVRPIPFLIPFYRHRGDSILKWRLGMRIYEMMSGLKSCRHYRFLAPEATLSMAPGIRSDGLIGGVRYYEASVSDNRLTMETIKDGVRNGGIALNHAVVTELIKENNRVRGAVFTNKFGGDKHYVKSRAVINATGVWADQTRKLADPGAANIVRLSKGTHLVFASDDIPLTVSTAFFSPIDNRPLFLIKRDSCFLFGTTDEWVTGSPDIPVPSQADVMYLLDSLRRFMPRCHLDAQIIQFVYSGFRALPVKDNKDVESSLATRENYIEVSPSGLITVVGGKLSTARTIAERVLGKVIDATGHSAGWAPCRTRELPIGGPPEEIPEEPVLPETHRPAGSPFQSGQCPSLTKYFQALHKRYGLDAVNICADIRQSYLEQNSNQGTRLMWPEVEYLCRNEMVCTPEDLMERRFGFLSWSVGKRLAMLKRMKPILRAELILSAEEFEEEYRKYCQHLKHFHTLPEPGPPDK
ncbi:MAG: glycerol-3-phosphate dehydrogenase/oxidase [Chloroflexi bacterium]|nr:glycerol-3-phosphate dehydrogenase/oxidase [Chloroflexota bacterium]